MIRRLILILPVLALWGLSACTTTSTGVVLLPDAEGKVGAITVTSRGGDSTRVDQAYGSVTTAGARLSDTKVLQKEDVAHDYADLLAAEPSKPMAFTLYFELNSADLVERSRQQLPQIIDEIKKHLPTEVNVIGHADTRGSDAINDKLSLRRAQQVEKLLHDNVPGLGSVSVRSFGSKDPLVPTPPNTDEPRNRRVEILIL